MASVLRIIATILIFVFHYQGQTIGVTPDFRLDKIGIFIFVVISGYFSFRASIAPLKWLIKRVKQIMIPYWIVIALVLIVNSYVGYKDTNIWKNLIVFFGGSLFLKNPVYVISWFITYILLLYLCVFFYFTIKPSYLKLFFLFLSGAVFYLFKIGNIYYFIGFFSGLFFGKFWKQKQTNQRCSETKNVVGQYLYIVQNHSYSFFLLHGGILKLVFDVFMLSGVSAFIFSFLITTIFSVYHKKLSDFFITKVTIYQNKLKNQELYT